MKYKKLIAIILASLGLLSLALAREEKFEENYKVEKAETGSTDRQIASEKEAEREPSSTVAPAPEAAATEAPQPWLHKSATETRSGH